jgi:hypothetical protein
MRPYNYFVLSLVTVVFLLVGAAGCSSDSPPSRDTNTGQGGDSATGSGGSTGSGGAPSDGGPGAGPEGSTTGLDTQESVCRAAVAAQCQKRLDCGTSHDIGCFGYVNLCPEYYFGPGSNRTLEGIRDCVSAVQQMTCSELAVSALPACLIGGERATGMGCAYGSQCASTICSGSSQQCGTCLEVGQLKHPCVAQNCEAGAFCNPGTMNCEAVSSIV